MNNNIAANLFILSNGTEDEKNMITKETQIELSRRVGQYIYEHPEKFRFIEFPDLISTEYKGFNVVIKGIKRQVIDDERKYRGESRRLDGVCEKT